MVRLALKYLPVTFIGNLQESSGWPGTRLLGIWSQDSILAAPFRTPLTNHCLSSTVLVKKRYGCCGTAGKAEGCFGVEVADSGWSEEECGGHDGEAASVSR